MCARPNIVRHMYLMSENWFLVIVLVFYILTVGFWNFKAYFIGLGSILFFMALQVRPEIEGTRAGVTAL